MRAAFASLASTLALAAPAAALPDRPDLGWVADGPVNALVTGADGLVYAGGDFTMLAPRTGALAVIEPAQLTPRSGAVELAGTVLAVRSDDAGGWYVGGEFTVPDAADARNLVRITSSGALDPSWRPNPDGAVRALAVVGGTVVAGGDFTRIGAGGGLPRARLAAIATNGTATAWNPEANATVRALAQDAAGTIFVGGDFTQLGGAARSRLGALSLASPLARPWNPGADAQVRALAVADGDRVVAGGTFASAGGQLRARLAAIGASGAALAWNPGANGPVNALAHAAGRVYAGGEFTSLGGAQRAGLAAADLSAAGATGWAPEPDGPVDALAIGPGGVVAVGGRFTTVGAQAPRLDRFRFAYVDPGTGRAADAVIHATAPVRAIAVASSGAVALGGEFAGAGGVERERLAAIDPLTGAPSAWAPPVKGGPVHALTINGDTIYVGGGFTSVTGQARNRLAALERTTGALTPWDPQADAEVRALLALGSEVYAGGAFTNAGGQSRRFLAAIEAQSGRATAWNPSPTARVTALAPGRDGGILVGGDFTAIGSQPRAGVALLNPAGVTQGWPGGVGGGSVRAIALAGGVVVGGDFTSAGSQSPRPSRAGLAILDTASAAASSWNPAASGGPVNALAVQGPDVLAGGAFTAIAGQARAGLAAISPTGGPTAWSPAVGGEVRALTVSGTSAWAGGEFDVVGGRPQRGIASFTNPPVAGGVTLVEGRPATGNPLACRTPWSAPSAVATTWLRDGVTVATAPTYFVTAADAGRSLVCRDTATNRGGSSTVSSAPVQVEGPRLLQAVGLRGLARVGDRLVCDPGRWAGTPKFSYSWLRGSKVIAGATGRSRRLAWRDFNTRIICRVRAIDATGAAFSDSPPSSKVRGNPAVPDTRATRGGALVLRAGVGIAVLPRSLTRRSKERPRLVPVVLQTTRRGVVLLRVGGGTQAVRFSRPGIARVRVRAAAAFLPGLRSLPAVLVARATGGKSRVSRGSIRISGP